MRIVDHRAQDRKKRETLNGSFLEVGLILVIVSNVYFDSVEYN